MERMTVVRSLAAGADAAAVVARRFEAVVFDWDGTAVPDRSSDASEVRSLVEALSAAGLHLAVVTGTHVGNVDGQLGARPPGPGRVLFAVNRGSEVYEVDVHGIHLVERRTATADEDAALDRSAALTIERLEARGLQAEIVSQRLNRRKIDLIPLPAWADPPKARIDELLAAVEARLREAGISGLPEVVQIATAAARDAGLPDPRVTSDAKHVEIGLTDKSDAARWLYAAFRDEGIAAELVLLAGDELGPLGGLPGSDSLLLVPEARVSVAISVGVEPTGVPDGVVHLGGGPARFVALLGDQLARRQRGDVPMVAIEPGWSLVFDGIDHERERAVETLLTLADGSIGTSGAPLLGHPSASPGVVVAGVYRGEDAHADLLDAPRWDRLGLDVSTRDVVRRALDLRTGLLAESVHDDQQIESVRFCSLARPGTAVLRVAAAPPIAMGLALVDDGPFDPVERTANDAEWARLHGKVRSVAVAAANDRRSDIAFDRIAVYERLDGDRAHPDHARERLTRARGDGFDVLLAEHRRAWARRWEAADVRIEGDDELQLAARVALFHLMASVADHDEATVGARGLSGHGYRGHVFWDTDVFVLPFLAATHTPAARAIIEYRVRRLPAALAAARAEGHRGAKFPWESATFGDDVTPRSVRDHTGKLIPIRTGDAELHIVADVAWAAGCYVDWSGDTRFAAGDGHRLLVETARYWASRTRLEPDGAHLYGVIGPDEYHEPVDDNMFTNVLARWNLRRAAASAVAHGGVDDDERRHWCALADAMVDGYDVESGVYEQFAGFFALEPVIVSEVAPRRPVVADLLLGRDRVRDAQVVKQADVLMAHHLVPEECEPGSLERDVAYYEPRTAHGSSLSPGVHASVLARAGLLEEAVHWLRVAAHVDLADVTATTASGLHLATMGSVWQALAWGFAGLRARPDALTVDPRLPAAWNALDVHVTFRGVPVRVRIDRATTRVTAASPIGIAFGTTGIALECGPEGITFDNRS